MPPGAYEQRRRFSRISFHRHGELESGAERASCEVLDISLKGALVEAPHLTASPGERCVLAIQLDAADTTIRMDGEIAHREGTLVGVRCTGIDLDSIAHLRRLVELNLGDEEVLQRELSALVGGR